MCKKCEQNNCDGKISIFSEGFTVVSGTQSQMTLMLLKDVRLLLSFNVATHGEIINLCLQRNSSWN